MRILYHHRTQADGAEGVHIAEMVRAFRELGHDVRVVGREASPDADTARPASRIKSVLPTAAFELVATAYNVPEYLALRQMIAGCKPDLVYARHTRFGVGAARATREAGVPLALEVNCLFADDRYLQFEPLTFRGLARTLERRALDAATVVFAVSTPLADRIGESSTSRVVVLPNGADPVRFDPAATDAGGIRRRFDLGEACLAGWVGILRPWHGLDLLLEAVTRVDGLHLLLVGDGPARTDVEARAAALGISRRVVITGRVSHRDVAACVAAMDIAVVADERTGVASPMKLLEYMAMERAVVAPDLPNIRDVVRPEVNGLLFVAGDREALAGALRRLSGDRPLRHRLGAQARCDVTTHLNWRANAKTVLAEVRLAEPGPPLRRQ